MNEKQYAVRSVGGEIKYDESIQELKRLGLANEMGVVINRNGYNLYMAVVQTRREVRALPEFESLRKSGVVSETGAVLDAKKFQDFQHAQIDLKYSDLTRQR